MKAKQVNRRLRAWQTTVLAPTILLALVLVSGYAEAQIKISPQIPTATPDALDVVTSTNVLTETPSSTPTAIAATMSETVTPQSPITLTVATTVPITTSAPPGLLPELPLLQCGPRLFACGCATPELRYVFPVQPPEVVNYGEAHHDYPATDIFAPYRSVFVAVTSGVIDELSYEDIWDPAIDDPALRSGRYVVIIGDDGVRYHGSHLDEVVPGLAAGDRVAAGQLLGYVGNSGNARGIAHHLHFGISYPTFAGDWETRRGVLSPYPYLKAWAQHELVKPDLSLVPRK